MRLSAFSHAASALSELTSTVVPFASSISFTYNAFHSSSSGEMVTCAISMRLSALSHAANALLEPMSTLVPLATSMSFTYIALHCSSSGEMVRCAIRMWLPATLVMPCWGHINACATCIQYVLHLQCKFLPYGVIFALMRLEIGVGHSSSKGEIVKCAISMWLSAGLQMPCWRLHQLVFRLHQRLPSRTKQRARMSQAASALVGDISTRVPRASNTSVTHEAVSKGETVRCAISLWLFGQAGNKLFNSHQPLCLASNISFA